PKVSNSQRCGQGVQGTGRSDPPQPPRPALSGGRTNVDRARRTVPDDAVRRDEAPEAAGRGWPGGDQAARAGEAPFSQPYSDPACPRSVGEQVRRTMDRGTERAKRQTGGTSGESFRDLHQDNS